VFFSIVISCGPLVMTVLAGDLDSPAAPTDPGLVPGNIKNGVSIFGVTGHLVDGSNATRVPKTGQTECWETDGTLDADCSEASSTGQDGDLQKGVLPAVSPSDGVYGSYTVYGWAGIRFTDNLDGTVTDNLTGLIWLKNANCFGPRSWANALSDSNGLANGSCSLTDSSSAGDWRLPNINELHSLVDPTLSNPALPAGHPFTGVQSSYYWSSSTYAGYTGLAWLVLMSNGLVNTTSKSYSPIYYVWPVRSGN
jgi:hypothetical protein